MAVALYARVSTTRQAENELSIPDQLQQMRDWCQGKSLVVANEYVELGASARDDKRPVFLQMIADALLTPNPYDTIIVHSLSRFFRDSLHFALYERKLEKAGVKLVSITQQTSEDSAGEMARKFFSIFDEYQSKENAKHTLRAMRENAKQGFFNGSRPPYGYKAVETAVTGNRGRKKKRLVIESSEAETVRYIYRLYLSGHNSLPQGMKGIASLLNRQGYTMRGNPWRAQKIHRILADTTYKGEFVFNRCGADKRAKPKDEWVKTAVDSIIDAETFERAGLKREASSPQATPPRLVSSPIFLSGLLKCGQCGSGMTLMTGKSGRYRYYKCDKQKHSGKHLCDTPNVPMEKLDNLVRERLIERVFTPSRVRNMLHTLKNHIKAQSQGEKARLSELQRSLTDAENRLERLYEGFESGVLTVDSTLQNRIQRLKARREEVILQIAGLKRRHQVPLQTITTAHVGAFCESLKRRLRDSESGFGKGYLRLLVDEITVTQGKATIRGGYGPLAELVSSLNAETAALSVPSTMCGWRARRDYRRRYAAPLSRPTASASARTPDLLVRSLTVLR